MKFLGLLIVSQYGKRIHLRSNIAPNSESSKCNKEIFQENKTKSSNGIHFCSPNIF